MGKYKGIGEGFFKEGIDLGTHKLTRVSRTRVDRKLSKRIDKFKRNNRLDTIDELLYRNYSSVITGQDPDLIVLEFSDLVAAVFVVVDYRAPKGVGFHIRGIDLDDDIVNQEVIHSSIELIVSEFKRYVESEGKTLTITALDWLEKNGVDLIAPTVLEGNWKTNYDQYGGNVNQVLKQMRGENYGTRVVTLADEPDWLMKLARAYKDFYEQQDRIGGTEADGGKAILIKEIVTNLNNMRSIVFMAIYKEQLVGAIEVFERDRLMRIGAFFILPEFHGQGYGKVLYRSALVRNMIRMSAKFVAHSLISDNEKMQRFSRKYFGLPRTFGYFKLNR